MQYGERNCSQAPNVTFYFARNKDNFIPKTSKYPPTYFPKWYETVIKTWHWQVGITEASYVYEYIKYCIFIIIQVLFEPNPYINKVLTKFCLKDHGHVYTIVCCQTRSRLYK